MKFDNNFEDVIAESDNILIDYLRNLKCTKKTKVCFNCEIEFTPQWRSGSLIGKTSKHRMLCNSCGISYQKYGECLKCKKIFTKEILLQKSHHC